MSQREPERARESQREPDSETERARERHGGYEPTLHFNQPWLTEENAHQEMVIAENGPVLVHATPLLTRALDKYFLNETKSSEWHFFPTYETGFYLPDTSKTIKRLQKEQSRLSFMDK